MLRHLRGIKDNIFSIFRRLLIIIWDCEVSETSQEEKKFSEANAHYYYVVKLSHNLVLNSTPPEQIIENIKQGFASTPCPASKSKNKNTDFAVIAARICAPCALQHDTNNTRVLVSVFPFQHHHLFRPCQLYLLRLASINWTCCLSSMRL